MKADTITVRVVREEELSADSADLTVIVEGGALFSGAKAFQKAKELRVLADALKEVGIDESQLKLRHVELNSQSFAMIKTSSAKYVVGVEDVSLETLPSVLSTVASHKGMKLSRLEWNYDKTEETKTRLRAEAVAEALRQAKADAAILGVEVLAVHDLAEESDGKKHQAMYFGGVDASALGLKRRGEDIDVGFQLGNSMKVTVRLRAKFRVGPLPTNNASSNG